MTSKPSDDAPAVDAEDDDDDGGGMMVVLLPLGSGSRDVAAADDGASGNENALSIAPNADALEDVDDGGGARRKSILSSAGEAVAKP